jgi:hypothetical protein
VAPPPPDPAQLAQSAIGQLSIPPPKIGIGPDFNKVAVNLWTWLWIDEPAPVSITVTAGAVSVTAVARLSTTEWTMGEPVDNPDTERFRATNPVICQGAGVAPVEGEYDWKAEPPCGYMYKWRSLKERTNGTGMWPVSVTANWAVTWTATTGQTGTETLTATAATAVDVGEYRIVLVPGPDG